MIAKVHIAKVQLGLTDDDYRAVMLRVTGRLSAADCSDDELGELLGEFAAKGFKAKATRPVARSRGPRPADHPSARKARALWISLHQLGAIDDPSEGALEAFARRQLKCERLQWANQTLAYRLVEALKAIAARHGWDQSTEGVRPNMVADVLKRRLVDAIVAKLRDAGIVPTDWSTERAGFELTGAPLTPRIQWRDAEAIERLAAGLGAKLRTAQEKSK